MGVYEVLVLFVLVALFLWVFAVIDVLRSYFAGNNKLIWFLAVTFIPLLGPLGYFFVGGKQKIKKG